MTHHRQIRWVAFIGCTLLCLIPFGCNPDATVTVDPVIALQGQTMGTTFNIRLSHVPKDCDLSQVNKAIEAELQTITDQMSTWKKDSEISRFNQSTSTDWFPVSKDFAFVIKEAITLSERTEGAFDITLVPLLELWNFSNEETPDSKIPSPDKIKAAKELVNYQLLSARLDPPALKKENPALRIEVAAIAQGHGVDRIVAVVEKFNITNYMIEIGGELKVRGLKNDNQSWRIAIEKPTEKEREIYQVLHLTQGALATSGGYRHFHLIESKKYSHIIDPRTGYPVDHNLIAVTVIAERAIDADDLSTSLMVMGPVIGYNWATEQKVAAIFMTWEESTSGQPATLKIQKTPRYEEYEKVAP